MLSISLSGSQDTLISSKIILKILTLLNTMNCRHSIQNFRPCSRILLKIPKWYCICYRTGWTNSYFCDSSLSALMQANDSQRKITYFLVSFHWLHCETIGKCFVINFAFNILEFFFSKSTVLIHNFLYKTRMWKLIF